MKDRTPRTAKGQLKALGRQFRAIRRAQDVSQRKLADAAKVSAPTIQAMERQETGVVIDKFVAALNALGKTLVITDIKE